MTDCEPGGEEGGGRGPKEKWTDLGRLPERIRRLAYFWGGSANGCRRLYTLASTDGRTQDVAALRAEIRRIHDPRGRNELLAWLNSRQR